MRGEFPPPCQAFCSTPADKLQVRKFLSKISGLISFSFKPALYEYLSEYPAQHASLSDSLSFSKALSCDRQTPPVKRFSPHPLPNRMNIRNVEVDEWGVIALPACINFPWKIINFYQGLPISLCLINRKVK